MSISSQETEPFHFFFALKYISQVSLKGKIILTLGLSGRQLQLNSSLTKGT